MALPLFGELSMDDIRVELAVSGQTPFSLSAATLGVYATLNQCSAPYIPDTNQPFKISDWYGYCHTCLCSVCLGYSQTSCTDACTAASNYINQYGALNCCAL